jgi:hypothetical protein
MRPKQEPLPLPLRHGCIFDQPMCAVLRADASRVCVWCHCCRGDFVIVGDLMKSITLLVYKAAEGSLEVRTAGCEQTSEGASACTRR